MVQCSFHRPFRVGFLFGVRQHVISGHARMVSDDVEVVRLDPRGHVVVFAAPSPEHVTEPVDHLEMRSAHTDHAAEQIHVR